MARSFEEWLCPALRDECMRLVTTHEGVPPFYLYLGVSETADGDLFEPLDKQHRIFHVFGIGASAGGLAALQAVLNGSQQQHPS